MNYGILILTKNEENSIGSVIDEVQRFFSARPADQFKIFLSDDSTDQTAAIASRMGASIVKGGGKGLGLAYRRGLKAIAEENCQRIFVIDGDGQVSLDELNLFVSAMDQGQEDMILSSRFLQPDAIDYSYPQMNRIGTRLLARYLSFVSGRRFTDSHGGLRLLTREVALSQRVLGRHTYVQESILDAIGRGYRVREIHASWRRRQHGSSRVVASIPRYALRTAPYLAWRALWMWGRRCL